MTFINKAQWPFNCENYQRFEEEIRHTVDKEDQQTDIATSILSRMCIPGHILSFNQKQKLLVQKVHTDI